MISELMRTPMESPLLKAVREMNESIARLQSMGSMSPQLRAFLEANRKQQEMVDSFSRFQRAVSLLGKRH